MGKTLYSPASGGNAKDEINERFPGLLDSLEKNSEHISEIGKRNNTGLATIDYGQLHSDKQVAIQNKIGIVYYNPGKKIEPRVVLEASGNGDFSLKAVDAYNSNRSSVIASCKNGVYTFDKDTYDSNWDVIDYDKITGQSVDFKVSEEVMESRMSEVRSSFDKMAKDVMSNKGMNYGECCTFQCAYGKKTLSCVIEPNSRMTVYQHDANYDFNSYLANRGAGVYRPEDPMTVYQREPDGKIKSEAKPLLTNMSGSGNFDLESFEKAYEGSSIGPLPEPKQDVSHRIYIESIQKAMAKGEMCGSSIESDGLTKPGE